MIFSVVYLLFRHLLGCLMVLARGEVPKDAELVLLRHQKFTSTGVVYEVPDQF